MQASSLEPTEGTGFREVSGSKHREKEASTKSSKAMRMKSKFLHSQRQCPKLWIQRNNVKKKIGDFLKFEILNIFCFQHRQHHAAEMNGIEISCCK